MNRLVGRELPEQNGGLKFWKSERLGRATPRRLLADLLREGAYRGGSN